MFNYFILYSLFYWHKSQSFIVNLEAKFDLCKVPRNTTLT